MRHPRALPAAAIVLGALLSIWLVFASATVPGHLEQPGTQPGQANLESPGKCDNCHGGYDPAVEPTFNWRGGMMSHAARDPIFWAAVAVAEQDFVPNLTVWTNLYPGATPDTGGAGDLCIRCHTPDGWLGGRSIPTSGAALTTADIDGGVSCDLCHRLVDPGSAEGRSLVSAGREAYWTNPETGQVEGFYGSGQYVVDPGNAKRGPYDNAEARHQFLASSFQRSGDLCGTCHDVSNPAAGALAPNSGRLDEGVQLGPRAAFEYPPYAYGIVERTFSEWKASAWDTLRVSEFATLPEDLRTAGGAPEWASRFPEYNSSTSAEFNPPRTYSCQTCHMQPVTGQGCDKNPPVRTDLPLHDQTGGNTWMPEAMIWLSGQGRLRGGALPAAQIDALRAGQTRARAMLRRAAAVTAATAPDGASILIRVVNLTGHKLPSGYPEGRRIWVNVRFFDAQDALVAETGRYDPATADLSRDTRIYEVHPGISRDWAETLLAVGYDPLMPLTFLADGTPHETLGDLAYGAVGDFLETFHFVLNNRIAGDRRIPPYGMRPDVARDRNVLPVPEDAYPLLADGTYRYWDEIAVPVAAGAARAEIRLYYQSVSKEYATFLRHANVTNASGRDFHDAWLNTGMSPPEEIALAAWTAPPCTAPPAAIGDLMVSASTTVDLAWSPVAGASAYRVYRYRTPDRSDTPVVLTIGSPPVADDVLGDGVDYFYDVRGVNACGESSS
jgi:hypothetical protein